MIELLYLLLGLAGLVLAAQLVIKGALHIAERFKLSHTFVGLTILAIGTDLPELVINVTGAAYRKLGTETSGLIVGETIGTSMGQIVLTLGILGLFIRTLTVKKSVLKRDGLMMIVSVILLALVSIDGTISVFDGIIFLSIYLVYFFSISREEKVVEKVSHWVKPRVGWSIASVLAGFALLALCSKFVIDNALALSRGWGVSQALVGVLIVGLGTSLPELVVAFTAFRKKSIGLGVGNLIGSNIFDVLATLGIGAAISGFAVKRSLLYFDIPFLFASSLFVLFLFRKDRKLTQGEAAALIALFAVYAGLKLIGL